MPSEIVLEVGAEGGTLSVSGERSADGKWSFRVVRDETAFSELLSEEDREGLVLLGQSEYVPSLQDALKRLDRYPWFSLHPLEVHSEFFEAVLSEVRKRGGEEEETRWRGILEKGYNMQSPANLRARGVEMINLEAVIRHFGPQAVSILLRPKEREPDIRALQAIKDKAAQVNVRVNVIRGWLQSYGVFQGIADPQRTAISTAVLQWADSRDGGGTLATTDALCLAHESLMEDCEKAYGGKRDFTSLASKALWLCHPDDVPLFDSFAQRALWTLSKLENGIAPLAGNGPEYRQFIHVWKALYERYADIIAEIDLRNYEYSVRVFDKILWIIGSPGYKVVF